MEVGKSMKERRKAYEEKQQEHRQENARSTYDHGLDGRGSSARLRSPQDQEGRI
jgi:hypothetical protein